MCARNFLFIPLLLLLNGPGWAQQSAPVPDFSAGFKQLVALGLPPLDAQATWSVLPAAANTSYELRELDKAVKGNAWLLPSAAEKIRAIYLGGSEVIELEPAKKRGTAAAKPRPEPDLTKDVGVIVAGLRKIAAKRDADDPYSYSSGTRFGTFLLFAAQLYQTGHPELANQLAHAVFEVFPTREAAVDSAVDQLAEPLYQQATRAFFTSGGWAAYHQALAALSQRFPRGWSSREAVAIFLPQLAQQAAGAKAPAPTLPDLPIDPRALDIIRQLTDQPPADPKQPEASDNKTRNLSPAMRYRMQMAGVSVGDAYNNLSSLWILEDPALSGKQSAPLARLAALKMAAIPALAALTSDPFLTHLPNSRSYSGSYFPPGESGDERALRIHAALNRPATRGEIARQFLVATLPDPQNDLNEADPEALRDLALEFWKEHHDASREELAAVFLRDGNSGQASQAATLLAASTDPKAHLAFEAHVLAADPAIAKFQDVRTYLRARKATARPFFEAYAKLVRSQTQDVGDDIDPSMNQYDWAIKEAGGPLKILKQLEALVGGQTPRALAVQIAKGKPADAAAAIKSLTSLLADATSTKHLHALLEGANAATDATVRARFLAATFQVRWGGHQADDEQAEDAPPEVRAVSEPEAKVWRKLIADTRELPGEFSRYVEGGKITVAELAAIAFENSVSGRGDYEAYAASIILHQPVSAILIEQATARLAGKPVPPLPDASKVPKDRLAEIVATAGKKPAVEIHPYLSSLTPDERAAWLEWFNEPDDLAIPASVKELQCTIIARDSDKRQGTSDTKGAGNLDVGFKITPDSLTKHIEALAPEIDKHSRTNIDIAPAPFGPGLAIFANVAPLPAQKARRVPGPDFEQAAEVLTANETAAAVAIVSLQAREYNNSQFGSSDCEAIWLIQDGKATLQSAAPDEDAQEDNPREPFAATLRKLLESEEPQRFGLNILLLNRADAEKFKALSEEPDSSEESSTPTEEELPEPP
ncbi:MAG: hypothetical protein NTW21_34415 [Verrucomicrobia bacterium]|nr:hypothetical protein [Verrucomicrobiota bacterium]